MWFWFSLIALICWSGSDLFSKIGCQDADDKYSHLKMVMAVGVVMGLHAAYEIFINGTEISGSILLTYLPVSLLYISSMTIGYIGLRYIELSISSPICNSSGALVAVLALAGGVLFGLWWGGLYTFLGAILNCSLMFWMARNLGRAQIEALIAKKLSPSWQEKIRSLEGRTGFLVLILLRLIPAVPYNLINYAFGLTAMPFRTYLAASAIGIIPGTLAFINIGDKALDITSPDFWIALGLLGALLLATALLGKAIFPKEKKENKCNE